MTQQESFPISFSQMEPEASQAPPESKPSERNRLAEMDATSRSRLVTDLSRYLLFKALSNEPIDRTKLAKEAFPDNLQDTRVTNATLEKATQNMRAVFGFEVRRVPDHVHKNKNMPSKFKERLYVVNQIQDDENGSHSKKLHGYHVDSSIEKGLLMLILAFIYCKGEIKDSMRWLDAAVLYRLLNSVDENIPATPTVMQTHRNALRESIGGITSPSALAEAASSPGSVAGVGLTPNVDVALEKFVHMDYLVKKKFDNVGEVAMEDIFHYAIGPRALLVVGLKQIVHFCADILGQEPDPTMLQELKEEETEEAQVG